MEKKKSKSKIQMRRSYRGRDRRGTFVLHGLALGGRSAPGDGTRYKDNELLHARSLKVSEVAHVHRLRQYHRIRPLRTALQHRQRRDLHLPLSLNLLLLLFVGIDLSLSLSGCFRFLSSPFVVGRKRGGIRSCCG
jgi:hypothetical protein